jgi:hypothetical protein
VVGGYLRVKSKRQFRDTTWQIALSTVTLSSFANVLQGLAIQQGHLHLLCGEGSEAFNTLPAAIRHLGPWSGGAEGDINRLRLTRVVDHQRSDRHTAAPSDLWQWQFNLGQKRRGQLVRFGGDAAIGRSCDGGNVPTADVSRCSKLRVQRLGLLDQLVGAGNNLGRYRW